MSRKTLLVSERPRSLLLSLGVPSRPSPGSYPGPVQVPSRVRGGPVQIRHVLCFTVFRTHPGPEVGAIPARPGPILLPSVPSGIGPGRAETDFLATSDGICICYYLQSISEIIVICYPTPSVLLRCCKRTAVSASARKSEFEISLRLYLFLLS